MKATEQDTGELTLASGLPKLNMAHSFASSLLPPDVAAETLVLTQAGSTSSVSSQLRSLLDETADIFDSPDFTHVFQVVLDRLFETFTSTLEEQAFQDPPLPQGDFQHPLAKFEEMHEKTARLVDLLPASARESRSVMLDLPNRYLEVSFCCFPHDIRAEEIVRAWEM